MKYIKTFESIVKFKIEVGQYILVNEYLPMTPVEYKKHPDKKGKIVSIKYDVTFPYRVLYDDNTINSIQFDKIIRYLTDEEIDEYESKINANKFNI